MFGLNVYTTREQIIKIFERYGTIDRVQVVVDAKVSTFFVCFTHVLGRWVWLSIKHVVKCVPGYAIIDLVNPSATTTIATHTPDEDIHSSQINKQNVPMNQLSHTLYAIAKETPTMCENEIDSKIAGLFLSFYAPNIFRNAFRNDSITRCIYNITTQIEWSRADLFVFLFKSDKFQMNVTEERLTSHMFAFL